MSPLQTLGFALGTSFASGLNLYYAVQNITSIPQQWFLAKERMKRQPPPPPPAPQKGKGAGSKK